MERLYGDERRFVEFVSNIDKNDRIGVISHDDLDGMVPVRIIKRIFGKIDFLQFEGPRKDMVLNLIPELKKRKINKILVSDVNLNNEHIETQQKIEKFAEILIMDHHQAVRDFNSEKTVFILSKKECNAGLLVYELFSKLQNLEDLDFLAAMSVIADHNWEANIDFIKKVEKKYGLQTSENFKESEIWGLEHILANCNQYFREDSMKFYELLKGVNKIQDISKFEKYSKFIEDDLEKAKKDFLKNAEKYSWGYLFEDRSKYSLATKAAEGLKDNEFLIVYKTKKDGTISLSARRQDKKMNCAEILKKAIYGLEGATAGGHIPAAGARFKKEYFKKFKENLIKLMARE